MPGVSGNPAGKPPGTRHMSTLLEDAIKKVATDRGEPHDILIVRALIEQAKKGDVKAIREVFDRLEGKPVQTIDAKVTAKTDNPLKELPDDELRHIATGSDEGAS